MTNLSGKLIRMSALACVMWASVSLIPVSVAAQGMSMANHNPLLSPDGTKVLFDSDHEGNSEIYVIDIDGSNLTRLTRHPGSDSRVKWSDDGSAIYFRRSERPGAYPEYYRMNADGSAVEPVENGEQLGWEWSPDGNLVMRGAMSDECPPNAIFLMRADDYSDSWPLTTFAEGSVNSNMHFSPDGTTVVYESFLDNPSNGEVWVVGVDGENPTRLVDGTDPSWSPDGTQITFKRLIDGNWWVHVMNADGSGLRVVAEGALSRWMPDGRRILFMSLGAAGQHIVLIDVIDGTRTQLTR